MNVGEVENPGAFDSDEKKSSPVEGKNPPETEQPRDLDEPIGDDGVNYDVYADDVNAADAKAVDTKEMNFSAEDIRKKEKTVFFVNIKNADKIKRAEEKRKAADEKRILAEARRTEKEAKRTAKIEAKKRAQDQKYDDSQEKNARKELRNEQKLERKAVAAERHKKDKVAIHHGVKNFFWRGWHKYALFVAIIALGVLGFFVYRSLSYYYTNIFPKEQKLRAAEETAQKAEEDLGDFYEEVNKAYGEVGKGTNYSKACEKAEELIAKAKEKKDYDTTLNYTLLYIDFILRNSPSDTDRALKLADSVYRFADDDVKKMSLYARYKFIYSEMGDMESFNYYEELVEKLEIVEGDEEDLGGYTYAQN